MNRLALLEARIVVALRCNTLPMIKEVLKGTHDHSLEVQQETWAIAHDLTEYEKDKTT